MAGLAGLLYAYGKEWRSTAAPVRLLSKQSFGLFVCVFGGAVGKVGTIAFGSVISVSGLWVLFETATGRLSRKGLARAAESAASRTESAGLDRLD